MIAYFDTSAIVPMVIAEPGSQHATEAWNGAAQVVSCALLYPESRAAIAHAHRLGRIDDLQLRRGLRHLDRLVSEIETMVIDDDLALLAGVLAQREALRGADAVHLAAALSTAPGTLVLVAGDRQLLGAGDRQGLATLPLP